MSKGALRDMSVWQPPRTDFHTTWIIYAGDPPHPLREVRPGRSRVVRSGLSDVLYPNNLHASFHAETLFTVGFNFDDLPQNDQECIRFRVRHDAVVLRLYDT